MSIMMLEKILKATWLACLIIKRHSIKTNQEKLDFIFNVVLVIAVLSL